MKTLLHPVFWGACGILILHQVLEKYYQIAIPFADNYLDDFLAMPIILTIFWTEQRVLWKNIKHPLTIFQVTIFTFAFSIFFEEILPNFNANYTKDYWDYLAYILGSICFYLTINKASYTV